MKGSKGTRPIEKGPKRTFTKILIIVLAVAFVVYVAMAFSGQWPIYAGIPIGGFTARFYGFCLLAGVVGGAALIHSHLRKFGFTEALFNDLLFAGLFFGLIGARLGWAVQNLSYVRNNPLEIIGIRDGQFHGFQGLSIHGAVLSLLIYLFVFQKWRKIPWWKTGDMCVPALALGQAVGRWGNFFNQELYGYPTTLPWKMHISPEHRLPGFENSEFFHPVFLYESILDLATCWILLRLDAKGRLKPSVLMWSYGFLYGLDRFLVEIVRIEPRSYGPFSLAQVVSVAFMVIFGGLALATQLSPKR